MLEEDVILAKISIIKNCLAMIERATNRDEKKLEDQILQDVFVLNLQRAIQACIDVANALIAKRGLELPTSYKQAFFIIHKAGIIDNKIAQQMMKMVGFRNIAIHDYQALDMEILKSILRNNLRDFEDYCRAVYAHLRSKQS